MENLRKNNNSNKISKLAEKWTGFYSQKSVPFLCTILGILIVILVIVLILGAGLPKQEDPVQALMNRVRSKDVVVCPFKSVNNFFYAYYSAQASGDTTILETSFDDPKTANISAQYAQIVDHFGDFKIYVTPGLENNEIAAFVSYNIYFKNISTPAPAVDSFYLLMNKKTGNIQIQTKMYEDETINTFLTLISYRNPIRSLIQKTEENLYTALNNNNDLRNLYVVMSSMAVEGRE